MPTVHLTSPVGSKDLQGYLARPAGDQSPPGVVVVHETLRDPWMGGVAPKLERVLTTLGCRARHVKLYPQAGHSFLNDAEIGPAPLRPVLRVLNVGPEPTAAADAWRRIEAFFAEHLAR